MIRNLIGFALTTVLITSMSHADSLGECRQIVNDQDRLACYDLLAARSENTENNFVQNKVNKSVESYPETTINTQSATSNQATRTTQQSESRARADASNKTRDAQDTFGLENINTDTTIRTTIDGEFNGWEKGTVFKLANGQTWKVSKSDSRPVFRRTTYNPKVVISRGMFNSYKMKVEGVNRSVKVKRVQ